MNDIALSSNLLDRTSSTIYVSNIRHSTPINSIFNIFSKYGPLERCEIPENKFGKTRGFAFIEFENKIHAYTAFEDLSKQEILLDGRVLKLEWARATKLYKEDIQNLSSESKEKIMGAFSRNHNFDSRYSKKGNQRKISKNIISNNNNTNIVTNTNINTNNNTLIVNNNNKPISSSPSFSSCPSIMVNSTNNSNNNNTNISTINNSPTSTSNGYLNGIINNGNNNNSFELNTSTTNLNSSSNGIINNQQQPLTSPKKKTFIKKDQNETSPILTNSNLFGNNNSGNGGYIQPLSQSQQQHSPQQHSYSHQQLSQSQPHISINNSMNGGSSPSSQMKKLNNSTVNLNINSPSYQQNGMGNHQFIQPPSSYHHSSPTSHIHHLQNNNNSTTTSQSSSSPSTNPLLPIPGTLSKSLNGIGSTSYLDSNSIPIIDQQISNYGAYFGIPNFNQSFDFNLTFNQTLNNFSNLDLHSRIILNDNTNNNSSSSFSSSSLSTSTTSTNNIDGSSSSISGGSSLIGNVSNSPSKLLQTSKNNITNKSNGSVINTSPTSTSTLPLHQSNNSVVTTNLINTNGAIPTNGGSPNSSSPAISNGSNPPLMGKIAPSSITNQSLQTGFFNNDEYLTELNASLHSITNGNISNFSSSSISSSSTSSSSTSTSSQSYMNGNHYLHHNSNHYHHNNGNQHYFASSQDPIFISSPPGTLNQSYSHFSPISSFNNYTFFK